jgi:RsiW-degrading membrane proteinase PrsW (M82 family)
VLGGIVALEVSKEKGNDMAKRPGGAMLQTPLPTRSQLLPVLTKWDQIGQKSQLTPVIFTIAVFFLLLLTSRDAPFQFPGAGNALSYWTSSFMIVIASYLSLVSLYFLYRLVGKDKAWWVLMATVFVTGYCLYLFQTQGSFEWMYTFFHQDLAGGEPDANMPFLQLFFRHFVGTGFFEEMFKAMPLFAIVIASPYIPEGLRKKIGIEEPLDGILLGAAAGAGFAIVETLGQYVPSYLWHHWLGIGAALTQKNPDAWVKAHLLVLGTPGLAPNIRQAALAQMIEVIAFGRSIVGYAPALPQLIIRSIDGAFGHMAYSGYFGYFIGLSVLKPQKRWKILGIGLVSASIPHALWDSLDSIPLQALVATGSYMILAAAVLKAREISPNRATLQPSVLFGASVPIASPGSAAPGVGLSPVLAAAVPVAAAGVLTPVVAAPKVGEPPNLPPGTSCLRVGARFLIIVPGLRLLDHQVPGLRAQSAGAAVAEVTRNPNDPAVLGLTNMSVSSWEVVSAGGTRREIGPGQTIKLAPGTKIDFGATDGEVR